MKRRTEVRRQGCEQLSEVKELRAVEQGQKLQVRQTGAGLLHVVS